MKDELIIPKAGALDFASIGAPVTRLDSGQIAFHHARNLRVHVSGAELNPGMNLGSCFRKRVAFFTALVHTRRGYMVEGEILRMRVRLIAKWFEHDGVRGPTIAYVLSDAPPGVRQGIVEYDRANEAAALLRPGDFDYDKELAGGVRWGHSGGLFAALFEQAPDVIIDFLNAVKTRGGVRSYDLNYRAKLWKAATWQMDAIETNTRILGEGDVQVLLVNEEDMQNGLGIKGPDVEKTSELDPRVFVAMIENVVERFPSIRVVATTLRQVHSSSRHTWRAILWVNGTTYVIVERTVLEDKGRCAELDWVNEKTIPVAVKSTQLDVLDRVGGGDGFAAGLIYGFLEDMEPEMALRYGWAHGALVTTSEGDTTQALLSQVKALAEGGSARIQR